jgi:hypothetical protein
VSDKRSLRLDYHVEVEGHYHSVPYRFANEELSARLTAARWRCSARASGSRGCVGNFVFRAMEMLKKETSHGRAQTACYPRRRS